MSVHEFFLDENGNFRWDKEEEVMKATDGGFLQFKSKHGPFVVDLIPITSGAPPSPFESGARRLESTESGGKHITQQEVVKKNKPLAQLLKTTTGKRVMRYRYAVAVNSGDKVLLNTDRHGDGDPGTC